MIPLAEMETLHQWLVIMGFILLSFVTGYLQGRSDR